jgi:hypothetical protein
VTRTVLIAACYFLGSTWLSVTPSCVCCFVGAKLLGGIALILVTCALVYEQIGAWRDGRVLVQVGRSIDIVVAGSGYGILVQAPAAIANAVRQVGRRASLGWSG